MSSKISQEQNLAETYQQKTDIEHILDAPDTYIGPVDSDNIKNIQEVIQKVQLFLS